MDDQNRNLILATALSFAVIMVWFLVFPPPEQAPQLPPDEVATQTQDGITTPAADGTGTTPEIGAAVAQSINTLIPR